MPTTSTDTPGTYGTAKGNVVGSYLIKIQSTFN